MKYHCMDCEHEFNQLGKTYTALDIWCVHPIAACPQCGSDDYIDLDEEIKPIPRVAMPVSTEALEELARKVREEA